MPLLVGSLRAVWNLRHDRQFASLAFMTLVALVSGTVFYALVEDLLEIDSLYFSVITLATVGYGDFTPQTDAGKLFTVVYVLIGVGILLSFVTRVAGQVVQTHMHDHTAKNGRNPHRRVRPGVRVP